MIEAYRRKLLTLARESIGTRFTGESSPEQLALENSAPEALCGREGAFVTLKIRSRGGEDDRLRGCIGNIVGHEALYRSIWRLARESAFNDPRFQPLREEEMKDLRIEISLLSVPERIDSPQEIVVGRDGVLLSRGYHQAVFLPQVAAEQGWDREMMLDYLALKAGLPVHAWRDSGCNFEVFQAEIFMED